MQKALFGKLAGGLLGYISFGWIGLLIGVLMGHWFDKGLVGSIDHMKVHLSKSSAVFFQCTFEIMGCIAKADGYVSPAEIQVAYHIMNHLNLTDDQRTQAIAYFNAGKSPDYNLEAALLKFKESCGRDQSLIQLFLEIQLQAALSEGVLQPPVQRILIQICHILGISTYFIDELTRRSKAEQDFHRYYSSANANFNSRSGYHSGSYAGTNSANYLKEAYGVLGLNAQATPQEIKKAYRRLMSEHHPDKLAAKGLPESMKKIATEKTQQIQKAYEIITKARNL